MLSNEWQKQTKRWGHPLHAMCSYMGMFPPRLPHYFIQKFTHRGDIVLDPFSGRGTTALQACVEGRIGIGVDLNPLAYFLTQAKVQPPDPIQLQNRIDFLSNDMFYAQSENEPDSIRMLYHPQTLSQLVYLKQELVADDRTDAFIIGVLLGMLHGGALGSKRRKAPVKRKKTPTYLSIPMPNTFSMSENYIRNYVAKHDLQAPQLDVFQCLRARIDRLLRLGLPQEQGRAWQSRIQDINLLPDPAIRKHQVQLICSSPPYLKVLKYGMYNWIRLWFLDEHVKELDNSLDQHRKLEDYLDFMLDTSRKMYRVLRKGGVCVLVIGDVKKGKQPTINLAEEVWKHLKRRRTPFKLLDIIEDPLPKNSKVSKIWGEDKRGEATAIDRILVLYKSHYEIVNEIVTW